MATDLDIADETFIVADRAELASRFADPELWRDWWPELGLAIAEDRRDEGIRWSVHGRLAGTSEIWLEPRLDGVIVHWFVRARTSDRDVTALRHDMVRRHKRRIHALKDSLERTRRAGMPREPSNGYSSSG